MTSREPYELSFDEAESAGFDGTGTDGHPDFPHQARKFDVIVTCHCGHKYVDDSIWAPTESEAERFALIQEGAPHYGAERFDGPHGPSAALAVDVTDR